MKIKAIIFGGVELPGFFANTGWMVMRVAAGVMMAWLHGLHKIPVGDGFVKSVAGLGFPAPEVFAWMAALAELVGGALVALGVATRPAALTVVITMGVAAFGAHAGDAISVRESSLMYGAVFLAIFAIGGGRFSADHSLKS